MSSNTQGKSDDLQFDRVDTKGQTSGERLAPAVTCVVCKRSIDTQYWQANGKPVCGVCRQRVEADATSAKGAGPLFRAGIFGFGAAIAGAAIYFAVIQFAHLEIGIVAILIGYMVGYSVHKGAAGRGGRRYQIIATLLTYWAVGLAYAPFELSRRIEESTKVTASTPADSARVAKTATSDSARAVTPDSAGAVAADSARPSATSESSAAKAAATKGTSSVNPTAALVIGILVMLLYVFVLPVKSVIESMPGGAISAFIIFIGMRQAWQMTRAPKLEITGPYKVGGAAPATS
jgi:hypothetical protein